MISLRFFNSKYVKYISSFNVISFAIYLDFDCIIVYRESSIKPLGDSFNFRGSKGGLFWVLSKWYLEMWVVDQTKTISTLKHMKLEICYITIQ